jgi:hypothetical protein
MSPNLNGDSKGEEDSSIGGITPFCGMGLRLLGQCPVVTFLLISGGHDAD